MTPTTDPKRILLFGATGTAGQGVAAALVAAGHRVIAALRPDTGAQGLPAAIESRTGTPGNPASLQNDIFRGETFDAVISCLASRSGLPQDAWAVDHATNAAVLRAAKAHGVTHLILLSAICVQRPRLAFQEAKLAFEAELMSSDLTYSIVRPTAFFKSLAGQIKRVQEGKPFLVFGNGRLTAAKPISDNDLGRFITRCLVDTDKQNAILPIGGPGPALTPLDIGEIIFRSTGQTPRFRHVPPGIMSGIIAALRIGSVVKPSLAEKAELARIGRYYGTESMLLWDRSTGKYEADATPTFGDDTFDDYVRDVVADRTTVDLGEHAVF